MANEIITSHEELVKLVKDGCMRVGNGCILRRVGECGVSVWFEQRKDVGLWKPHLRAQNIAANVPSVCVRYSIF